MRRKTPMSTPGDAEQADGPCGHPADLVAVDDRVHGDDERSGHSHRAGDVQPRAGRESSPSGQHEQRKDDDGDPDRHVHEEDPVPRESVRDDPAEEHADRPAARSDEAEDAHRLRALGGLREERHDERERNCGDDGSADALDGPSADERGLGVREAQHASGR
jgi:hypothetical protein